MTKLRWRAISFIDVLVRGIWADTVRLTLRVMTPQPPPGVHEIRRELTKRWFMFDERGSRIGKECRSRQGVPGDRLWVKETWCEYPRRPHPRSEVYYKADGAHQQLRESDCYDGHYVQFTDGLLCGDVWVPDSRWCSPQRMPRRASRLSLAVEDSWPMQVQEITFQQALEAGADRDFYEKVAPCDDDPTCDGRHYGEKWSYRLLWDRLNAKRGYPWKDNPWVWATRFERLKAEV